jgi:hypothetical protein
MGTLIASSSSIFSHASTSNPHLPVTAEPIDLGAVSPGTDHSIVVSLVNHSDTPITLAPFTTSCDCLVPPATPIEVAAKATHKVPLEIHLDGKARGKFEFTASAKVTNEHLGHPPSVNCVIKLIVMENR